MRITYIGPNQNHLLHFPRFNIKIRSWSVMIKLVLHIAFQYFVKPQTKPNDKDKKHLVHIFESIVNL